MLSELIEPFTWKKLSKRVRQKIEKPNSLKILDRPEEDPEVRYLEAEMGSLERGAKIRMCWLVSEKDGKVIDAGFNFIGPSVFLAAAEALIDIIVGKNYDQARRVSAYLIDKHLRDNEKQSAFPPEANPYINIVLEACDQLALSCTDIPLPGAYTETPLPLDLSENTEVGYPDWPSYSLSEKREILDYVLTDAVKPYVEMDGGGVEILKIEENNVHIVYSGACNGCFASTGSTLTSIQSILRSKVHPELVVIPEI